MTSPAFDPAAFPRRPVSLQAPGLPPVRHMVYRCSVCGAEFPLWRNRCTCHVAALLHAHEVDDAAYQRLVRTAG